MKANLPTDEQVRQRAYEIYLQNGSHPGHEVDNWLQAQYELMQLPIRTMAELEPPPKRKRGGKLSLEALVQAAVILLPGPIIQGWNGTANAGAMQAASLPTHQQIKLALDVHAATIVVRILDGAKPQSPGFPRSNSLRRQTLPTETKPQNQPTVTTELTRPHSRKLLLRRGPERAAAGG